jgi:hypothetical protein
MTALQLAFAGVDGLAAHHLSVDGMSPRGPNLSHWPGNRTPRRFRADLSTGICLRFARSPRDVQSAFLDGATVVLNDHYDTDGFLSLLAVLRPKVALAREERLLAAAATGDFQTFQTRHAFAIDRIVKHLADGSLPEVAAEFDGLDGAARSLARYRWLLAHAELVLDEPATFAACYQDELDRVETQIQAALNGAIERELVPSAHLSILTTHTDVDRMVLNTFAAAYRVLHVRVADDGTRFRFHDRTESWFEMVTIAPPARRDLRPLAERLQVEEGEHGPGRWCADPPTEPVPELYFGLPGDQEYGAVTRSLLPSRLDRRTVERAFATFLGERDRIE